MTEIPLEKKNNKIKQNNIEGVKKEMRAKDLGTFNISPKHI